MLDKKMEMMLSVANLLTAEDLEMLRGSAAGAGAMTPSSDDPDEATDSYEEPAGAADGSDAAGRGSGDRSGS